MEKIHVFLDESGAFGFDFSKPNQDKTTRYDAQFAMTEELKNN